MKKNSTTNFTTSISKMNNIKIIRLQSGEDIIANYSFDEEEGVVNVSRPMVLFFKRLPTGKSVMMLGPWLPIELIKTNSAKLYAQDILTVVSPRDSLIEYYNNVTDDVEKTMEENGEQIEMSLSGRNNSEEENDEEEDDELDIEEIMNLTRGNITIH